MDPISISIELELATLIIAAVAGFATWMQNRHNKVRYHQRERHHRQTIAILHKEEHTLDKIQVIQNPDCPPAKKVARRVRAR